MSKTSAKPAFRVVLSDGSSCVLVAASSENARGIVNGALRDEPLDRGLTVVRVEQSDDRRRKR